MHADHDWHEDISIVAGFWPACQAFTRTVTERSGRSNTRSPTFLLKATIMTTRLSLLARRLFVAAAFAVPLAATATFDHADALDTVQKNRVIRDGVFMCSP